MGLFSRLLSKPLYKRKPKEIVEIIDPSLEYITSLNRDNAEVYLVKSKHGISVLKIGLFIDRWNRRWSFDHVNLERKVLEHLAGVRGIPELHKTYANLNRANEMEMYFSVLKQYIEGKPENWTEHTPEFQKNMEQLVRKTCQKGVKLEDGIAELKGHNIMVTEEEQPFFIDLGNATIISEEEQQTPAFMKLMLDQYKEFMEEYFPDLK